MHVMRFIFPFPLVKDWIQQPGQRRAKFKMNVPCFVFRKFCRDGPGASKAKLQQHFGQILSVQKRSLFYSSAATCPLQPSLLSALQGG
mmetsp:Transcript_53585/g.117147  ORF Transcript_53585/g.117147 Transcript_53585/m.117147 type:complete len:88 (+) Transcript_53585:13-276(+)